MFSDQWAIKAYKNWFFWSTDSPKHCNYYAVGSQCSRNISFYQLKLPTDQKTPVCISLHRPCKNACKTARMQECKNSFLHSCKCDCTNARMHSCILAKCTFVLAARMVMHCPHEVSGEVPDTRHFILKAYLLYRYRWYKQKRKIEHTNYQQTKHTTKIQVHDLKKSVFTTKSVFCQRSL